MSFIIGFEEQNRYRNHSYIYIQSHSPEHKTVIIILLKCGTKI